MEAKTFTTQFLKIILICAVVLMAGIAEAQFGGLFGRRRIPTAPQPLVSGGVMAGLYHRLVPEVPASPECDPKFIPGNDGVFRRTRYCHKTHPTTPSGFLNQGYDVPASFLTGFTEKDVIEQWSQHRFAAPKSVLVSSDRIPKELMTLLNVKAAQTWEALLECAQGNADLAREMYRTGAVQCPRADLIRTNIQEIRASMPTLASSVQIEVYMDGKLLLARENELRAQMNELASKPEFDYFGPQYQALKKQQDELFNIRMQHMTQDVEGLFEKYVPSMPRMHPIFAQIMIEEMLALIDPNVSVQAFAKRYKNERAKHIYFLQLVIWGNAVQDRGCASIGLWPSAARVAIETMGDRSKEILGAMKKTGGKVIRRFHIVACPLPEKANSMQELEREGMRLPQIYQDGQMSAWNDFRQLRQMWVGGTP